MIEHTIHHGPEGTSEMDPFCVKPSYMRYLLAEWFGHQISIKIIQTANQKVNAKVWLFVIKKLVANKFLV